MPRPNRAFLRTADVCAQFGVTRSALRHAIKARKLRLYRLRQQIFFRLSDLHAWTNARSKETQKRKEPSCETALWQRKN